MGFLDTLEKFGTNTLYIIAAVGIMLSITAFVLLDIQVNQTFKFALITAPLWLPVITFFLYFEYWMLYVQKDYDIKQGRVTLEVKLPQDVFKSPEAMELVLTQLHQSAAPDNHVQTYWDGKHPPKTALEIVSREGDVKFYMNVPRKKFKNIAETQLYAQYPGIEVRELETDYTAEIPWDPNKFEVFSIHMGLKKADAYPIKTYIEYGLDKLPKEEEKVDPIATMLEMMGAIGPGEYMWNQILIDANREVTFKEGSLTKIDDWKKAAKAEIAAIIKEANKRVGIDPEKNENQTLTMMNLSDGEKETIKAIERSIGKPGFNTVIRSMYIGKKGSFNPGERLGSLITGWRSYDDVNRNAIGVRWRTDVNWPWWQDPKGAVVRGYKKQELDEYKRRAYTYHTDADKSKVMTTEELATIFHIPGRVVTTPSVARIPSKRGEAPSNLPIGAL